MKKFLAGCWLALLPLAAAAQTPTTPPASWQQQVNYSIDVTLDDVRHELTGREELRYTNNSPETLPFIWFHLWPNAYRDNTTAFAKQQLRNNDRKFQFASATDRGFIDQLDFKVNGETARLEYDPQNPDVAKLVLPQPLAPGATATISTPFHVKLPASFSRLGHVGQSYQITQWYPKPAVLDQRGWHPMPYLNQGEFYSEFGSFDVRITLPANYVVGATGQLQNPEEQQRMEQLATAGAAKKTAEDFGNDLSFPASAPETKTLRYVQDQVHDFAWFADKRFNVLKSGVTLPSGRQVTSWVLFTNKQASRWIEGLQHLNDALTYYSKWVGEYPYASATAVDGALSAGSGMEYPMVTVTEPSAISHEVGHNWFYGILGSNERDYPWLDEGLNSYVDNRVALINNSAGSLQTGVITRIKPLASRFNLDGLSAYALEQATYQSQATRGLDQPVHGVASAEYGLVNYPFIVYSKTAALFNYLENYLGQEKFDAAMHAYFERWKFRHPYPEDLQASFEESTGQKLGWFFQDMLGKRVRYDATIDDVEVSDTVKVLVRNDSPAPYAVPVSTLDAQGKVLETLWSPVLGITEEDEAAQLNFRREGVSAVVVDANYVTTELNRRDDRLKTSGSFRRVEPFRLQGLFAPVQRWDRAVVNFTPVIGANTSDKFMLGAAFYSSPLVLQRLSYVLMPMYSFNQKELNGIADVNVNVLPDKYARRIVTGVLVQRFERYRKVEPSITFNLPFSAYDRPQHTLKLATASIHQQDLDQTSSIQTVEYHVRGGNALQKWTGYVEFNQLTPKPGLVISQAEARLLRAAGTYQRFYNARKSVSVRLFGGRFLSNVAATDPMQAYVLGLSGSPDYRYQTAFLDRQQISPVLAAQRHQTDDRDGAFKAYLPVTSSKWLSTLNLQGDLPVTSLKVFADFGATSHKVLLEDGRQRRLFYDAGLIVPIIPGGVFQFYVPVAGSQYSNGLPSSRKDFTDNLRFVFRLDKLNPFRLLDEQLAQ
ncbi:M1 family metallopeptidase [Hymenobacter sp. J193]|uniref:M1 family metallopeptidase n=1 Tax=Hymenobacter sp. J193 TaxID=2898429 RepID=UPI002151D913|nr:M1 family metallopeptidase [Hymenobacter sp. J193]MCR5888855.1 M1 family metallopeptidase [Hymenobacter sp. J193]